ncbi:MAG: hypothetical protein KDK30_02020 [Leptospiraceae bacterium]|nr:hypothetical protein [Leptospiraceae bacterium]
MEQHRPKMKEFVDKLWANPVIQNVPLHKKENQILGFIRENQRNLQAAFEQPRFFPGLSWDDSLRLLLSELTDTILHAYDKRLVAGLGTSLSPEINGFFSGEGGVAVNLDSFRQWILALMRNKVMRDQYLPAVEAVHAKFFERYSREILERRKLIYIDIVRRDRLDMAPDSLGQYLGLVALLRPMSFFKFEKDPLQGQSLKDLEKNTRTFQSAFSEMQILLRDEIGNVPPTMLQHAFDSTRGVDENPDISGAARLVNILVNRASEYDPLQKQDRGAESPDKSWFSINRRTARYNGYDSRFLEELYLIAGEEGW